LPPGTLSEIALRRNFLQDTSDDGLLFPSETGTPPLRPNNLWKREFQSRLNAVGLGWVQLPGSPAYERKPFEKGERRRQVSADQRGHGLGVSLGVYAFGDLDQKIEAVTKLEADVMGSSLPELTDEELPGVGSLKS
jgi:hypothetical protein